MHATFWAPHVDSCCHSHNLSASTNAARSQFATAPGRAGLQESSASGPGNTAFGISVVASTQCRRSHHTSSAWKYLEDSRRTDVCHLFKNSTFRRTSEGFQAQQLATNRCEDHMTLHRLLCPAIWEKQIYIDPWCPHVVPDATTKQARTHLSQLLLAGAHSHLTAPHILLCLQLPQ